MKTHIKPLLIFPVLLSFIFLCLFVDHAIAQGFLKELYSASLIKKGKRFKADGDYASAITKFSGSIRTYPGNIEAYYQLGLIFEDVMHDYDEAISLYKKVIIISKDEKPTLIDEELKVFDTLIENARTSVDRTIRKKFESIEKPKVPINIIIKPDKKILKVPKKFPVLSDFIYKATISNFIYKTTTDDANEFRLEDFSDNWYQISVPSIGLGWVRGKDVLKIVRKEEEAVEISLAEKAAMYERFIDLHPDSAFTADAKEKADEVYYDLAKKEDTISVYSSYLKKYPDGKHVSEATLQINRLMFADKDFLNDIDTLKTWIVNNPESTFLERAKKRVGELMFTQGKNTNDIISLKTYIAEYPQGEFVTEARHIIEDMNYNQAKLKDTVDSYKEYLDEYPDGKYVEDVKERIVEKELSAVLSSEDIEFLVKYLKRDANEEHIQRIKERIEELFFKKAHKADNDVDAIKLHEEYLQEYPGGAYAQEAKMKIEELSFNITAGEDTVEAYKGFIEKYPQSKYYRKAVDRVEELALNRAKDKDTIESYKIFLKEYPNSKFSQEVKARIEETAFDEAKQVETIAAYEAFINTYPDSSYVQKAKSVIEHMAFEAAEELDTIAAYEGFIEQYPGNQSVKRVERILETKYFEKAKQKGTLEAYEVFVKLFPDSSYIEYAEIWVDRLVYTPYREKSKINALEEFINKYPENRYANEAREKITEWKLTGEPGAWSAGIIIGFIVFGVFSTGLVVAAVLMRKEIAKNIQAWQTGDWKCKCGKLNTAEIKVCSDCGESRLYANKAVLAIGKIKGYFGKTQGEQKKQKEKEGSAKKEDNE